MGRYQFNRRLLPALGALVLLAAACGDDPDEFAKKQQAAKGSPAAQGGTLMTTSSGLQIEDIQVGSGASPKPGQTVVVHYTGTLADGKKFDSSRDKNQPFQFQFGTGQVIKGWDEGLATMKVGGRRKLVIPPALGYGARDVGNGLIPANSTLFFDVELLEVK